MRQMDAIDAFDIEKEPTEKFIDEFKDFVFTNFRNAKTMTS